MLLVFIFGKRLKAMVVFNDLRLADDKNSLLVDCFVEDLNIYENVYITEIAVDYYKNVETSGVASDKAIVIFNNDTPDTSIKAVHACLTKETLAEHSETFGTDTFDGGLFYVFVTCSDTVSAAAASLPCGYDDVVDIGVVPDWKMLYEIGMNYTMRMAGKCFDECADQADFIQFLLIWNSLKMAIDTCEFALIEKVWDRILRLYRHTPMTFSAGCGCKN